GFTFNLYPCSVQGCTQGIRSPEIEVACTATMLVQLGLDIHEEVTNEEEIAPHKIRNRQLQILAGDYFSSRYFLLLSSYGMIGKIRELAISIKGINQQKVLLYEWKQDVPEGDFDRWLEIKTRVESGLLLAQVKEESSPWSRLIVLITRLALIREHTRLLDKIPLCVRRYHQGLNEVKKLLRTEPFLAVRDELFRLVSSLETSHLPALAAEEM
ncbi:MAG: heptaprenyl diphosphate synthase component 1, partial [Thermicanus sp.]|nr:heptaprenyl diphosphate synthase component 1 [Thermicanus sp.]